MILNGEVAVIAMREPNTHSNIEASKAASCDIIHNTVIQQHRHLTFENQSTNLDTHNLENCFFLFGH